MEIYFSLLALSLCVLMFGVCTSHPHAHRRRHLGSRVSRNHVHLCSHVTNAMPADYPLTQQKFSLVESDTERLLNKLACEMDKSTFNQMMSNEVAGKTQPYPLSQTDYSTFIRQLLDQMRHFYDEFQQVLSELSTIQFRLFIDKNNLLVMYTQLLVNDLQELMCYIHRSTAVRVPAPTAIGALEDPDKTSVFSKFIPLLKNFQSFIFKGRTIIQIVNKAS